MTVSSAKTGRVTKDAKPAMPAADLRELFDALPAALVVIDDALVIQQLNYAAEHLLRISREQSGKLSLKQVMQSAEGLEMLVKQVQKSGSLARETDYPLMLVQEKKPVFVTLQLVPLSGDVTTGIHRFLLQLEPPPRHSNPKSLEMVDRLATMAAMLNHEIKNPLSAIRAAAQHLSCKLDEAGKTLTSMIGDEVERIRYIIDELEIFSNPQQIATAPLNLHHVLRTALEVNAEYLQGIKIMEEYDPSLPEAQVSERLLLQALRNIIKNAAEAMAGREGSILTLRTRYQVGGYRQEKDGSKRAVPLTIEIIDNGPGVPEDIRHHLFEAYVSRKESGKGLGLAIVTKIIADHQGVIEYVPIQPHGSCFRLQLPAVKKA
jgi:two-component system, NtrC family, nitrogen regulation sensor histidine kinase GlnL